MATRRRYNAAQAAALIDNESDQESTDDDFGEGNDNDEALERDEDRERDEFDYDSDESTNSEDIEGEYRSRNNFLRSKRRPYVASYRRQNIVSS